VLYYFPFLLSQSTPSTLKFIEFIVAATRTKRDADERRTGETFNNAREPFITPSRRFPAFREMEFRFMDCDREALYDSAVSRAVIFGLFLRAAFSPRHL
jgi:hypothetical protein